MREEITIHTTLSEILSRLHHDEWERFCKDFGWSTWVVNEGGGHIEVVLTEEQAKDYGVM